MSNHPTPSELDAHERVMRRVTVTESGCWVCDMTPSHRYAEVRLQRRSMVRAHRLTYAVAHGLSVYDLDPALVIDHVAARGCEGGHCCNPAHLELVTSRENTMRGNGPTADQATRTHCPRGHALQGANLKPSQLARGMRECLVCDRAHGRVRRARERRGEVLDFDVTVVAVLSDYPELAEIV